MRPSRASGDQGGGNCGRFTCRTEARLLDNNAAYTGGVGGLEEWNRSIETNLTAPMQITQAYLGLLQAARGSVFLVLSTRAVMSETDNKAYSSAKADCYVWSIAESLSPDGARVASCPGGFMSRTGRVASGRTGSAKRTCGGSSWAG